MLQCWMLQCCLRITRLIGASAILLLLKLVVVAVIAVSYLAALMVLQHLKATYLGGLCETVLCWVSAEARRKVLLSRLEHLETKTFYSYYHGRKPALPVLFNGLSIVCDWWRTQSPNTIPSSAIVYLRLTCRTLHRLPQLAATHLNLKAPLNPSEVQSALNRPATWIRVQRVSYLYHTPEQVRNLTLLATAWPNLRQLTVTKPQYLHLRQKWNAHGSLVWQSSSSSSSSSSHGVALAAANDVATAEAGAAAAAGISTQPITRSTDFSSSNIHPASSSCSNSSSGSCNSQHCCRGDDVLLLVAGVVSSAHHWPFLQCLSLPNLGLTPAAAQLLIQAAVQWPLLRYLDVTDNRLGSCGVQILLDAAMQYWQQLEVLDIRGNFVSSSSRAGTSGSCSSSSSTEVCGSLELLGLLSAQVNQLLGCGWRKVVIQSHQQPWIPTAAADGGSLGPWPGISHCVGQQQLQQCSSSSCQYIPTQGLMARRVYLLC